MPDLVSIRKAESYDPTLLSAAVSAHFDVLHLADDLTPETRVLLKPNLLAARDPALAVTTHPALLRAVAEWLLAHGVRHITLADSPGGVYTAAALRHTYAACGLDSLSDVLTLNTDTDCGEKNGFTLLRPVLEADLIIDCAKLKTHGLTAMSGAVKNLFGCIPGLKKPEWHCARPTLDGFSRLLLDLCETVKPRVALLDAIDCMEGNGPGGGTVRHMGVTLASRSPYALDELAARLMGMSPALAPVLRAAQASGLCDPSVIETVGDALPVAQPPFLLPDSLSKGERFFTAKGLFHHFCGRHLTLPTVDERKCVGCGRCAESCPKKLITIESGKALMQRKGCISCFCCQEMCPCHAISAVRKHLWQR